jgi:hypothetical protein
MMSRSFALLDLSATRLYGTPDDRKKEAPRVCSNREGLRGVRRTGALMKLDAWRRHVDAILSG